MTYEEHHAALVQYLKVKVEQADWHGVSDVANDLRVLEAQQITRNSPLIGEGHVDHFATS